MYNRDEMFSFCETAHKHKDKLMAMMMEHEEAGTEIPMEMKIDYLINRAICKDNMREVTRTEVWEPVNTAMRAADGITPEEHEAAMTWRQMLHKIEKMYHDATPVERQDMRLSFHKLVD